MKFVKDDNKTAMIIEGDVCKHCGDKVLVANTVDAAQEKHVPVATFEGDILTVKVGSVEHPMLEEHHIAWIAVETKDGGMYKKLPHTGKPVATFKVNKEDVVAVYEFCNLHGLWKIEL